MQKLIILSMMLFSALFANAQSGYEKSIELGGAVAIDNFTKYSFEIDMINGYRFNDLFSIGIGIGFRYTEALYYESHTLGYYYKSYDGKYLIPCYSRIKASLSNAKVSPFFLINIGGTLDVGKNPYKNTHGLMVEPAFGVDFRQDNNTGYYFLVGFNLQNSEHEYFGSASSSYKRERITGMAQSLSLRIGFIF